MTGKYYRYDVCALQDGRCIVLACFADITNAEKLIASIEEIAGILDSVAPARQITYCIMCDDWSYSSKEEGEEDET